MPYYNGDYYRGDYYRGDLFGKIFKGVAGAVKGFVTGGPVGALQGGVKALVASGNHPSLPKPAVTPTIDYSGGGMDVDVPAHISNYPVTPGGGMDGNAIPAFAQSMPPTRGYHLNKSTYETRGGGTSRWPQSLQLHKKGTTLVKNRRMNVGNARALKRALRRAGGFARLARRVMSFTHPKAGRGRFKVGKRARR